MDSSFISGKQARWKRPLIGGVLSSITAGLTICIFYLMPNVVSGFLGIIFLTPAYIVESSIAVITTASFRLNEALGIFISILFWLGAGAIIAQYFKKNKVAIGCWFLLYLSLIPVGFGIFFLRA